jgi:hypothetical protein
VTEEYRCIEAERAQEFGQDDARFGVHVIDRSRFAERLRTAVPVARICDDGPAGCGGELRWEIAPRFDRSEAFVQQDDGLACRRSGDVRDVQPAPGDNDRRYPRAAASRARRTCR